jgi:uncharacterized protein (TIGR02172 family)
MPGRPDSPYPLDRPIAAGRTAEIYAWGEGRVLKLTRPGFPAYLADQEWRNALAAWQLGAPVPKPFELIEIDGRRGVVFERIQGPNLLQSVQRHLLRLPECARLLARQQAALHTIPAPMFPSQRQRIQHNIAASALLPDDLKGRLLQRLDTLPDSDKLCHDDFHPENILLTTGGPLIIDWEGCTCGSPSADVAVTRLWIRSVPTYLRGVAGWLLRQGCILFERAYLAEYNRAAAAPAAQQTAWIALVAAARLSESNRLHLPSLAALIKSGLSQSSKKVKPFTGEGIL